MTYEELKAAGFSDAEAKEAAELYRAGFSDDEIIAHYEGAQPQTSSQPQQPGVLSQIGGAVQERGREFIKDILEPWKMGSTINAAGELAGLAGDVGGALLGKAYDVLAPESVKPYVKQAGEAIVGSAPVRAAINEFQQFEQANPELGELVRNATNIVTAIPIGSGAKAVAQEAIPARVLAKKTVSALEQQQRNEVVRGFNKGIRPKVGGKSTWNLKDKYYDKANTAVNEIIARRGNNPLPRTVGEFSQAIHDTKKSLYREYNELAKDAGSAGVMVNLKPFKKELSEIAQPRENVAKSINDAARRLLDEYENYADAVNPEIAEELLAQVNALSKQMYQGANPNDKIAAAIAVKSGNTIRKQLNDAVEGYQGPGYKELRDKYGAFRSIEKEVTDRATVADRAAPKGFFDLTDSLSTGAFIHGLAKMDMATMFASGGSKLIKMMQKAANNPDKIVSDMFDKSKHLSDKMSGKISPKAPYKKPEVAGLLPAPATRMPYESTGATNFERLLREGKLPRQYYDNAPPRIAGLLEPPATKASFSAPSDTITTFERLLSEGKLPENYYPSQPAATTQAQQINTLRDLAGMADLPPGIYDDRFF